MLDTLLCLVHLAMLTTFRASDEIETLKAETSNKVAQLQAQVGQEESEYKVRCCLVACCILPS
jgi:hypothetical protein